MRDFNGSPSSPWWTRMPSPLKAVACVATVAAMTIAGAVGSRVEGKASASHTGQMPGEFSVTFATDKRSDRPGLSTMVGAGAHRFMFDCGLIDSGRSLDDDAAPEAMAALFLTQIGYATAEGIDRVLAQPRTGTGAEPLRIWGPPGTRDWLLRLLGDPSESVERLRPFTVVDLHEGVVTEEDGLTVAAIAVTSDKYAYRVGYSASSLLIAADATFSEHLVNLSQGLEVALLRHTDPAESARILQRINPRRAVLSQDGIVASAAQIREHYNGAFELVGEGAHRLEVATHPAVLEVAIPTLR